jgi:hypothetical protein
MHNHHRNGGSFSAALEALKAGQFVRNTDWGDQFLVMVGAHRVPTDNIADESLRSVLEAAAVTGSIDCGNLRKFDLAEAEVVSGWLPTIKDLLSDNWVIYDADDVKLQQQERTLKRALGYHTSREALLKVIAVYLTDLGIDYGQAYTAGSHVIDLTLNDDHDGIIVRVGHGAYSLVALDEDLEVIAGTGGLRAELQKALRALGRPTESEQEFHRTLLTVEVLSDEPLAIGPGTSLHDIIAPTDDGYVWDWRIAASNKVGAKELIELLREMGDRDPSVFGLTPDGKEA